MGRSYATLAVLAQAAGCPLGRGRAALGAAALAALLSACGGSHEPPPRPAEVELAATAPSEPSRSGPLVVAAAPEERPGLALASEAAITEEPCDAARSLRSLHSDTSLHIDFVNRARGPVSLAWIDFQGRLVHYADLAPGEGYRQQTFVTHPWVAIDGEGRCRGVFVPRRAGTYEIAIAWR